MKKEESPIRTLAPESLKTADPLSATNCTIERIDFSESTIQNKDVRLSRFSYCGFKGTHFRGCNFNHSYFDRCYFRKAQFNDVSLIGCTFKDCRFGEAVFENCKFDEAEFENCSITYEQLAATLPQRQNVLWRFARNLRVNSQNRGQTEDARKFLLGEIKASETHNFKKAFAWNEPFYKMKYGIEDRLLGFWQGTSSKMSDVFWGYGEKPSRVLRASAVAIVIFALVFYYSANLKNIPGGYDFLECLGFSAATFVTATYGEVLPSTRAARILCTCESAVGLVMFGFFVTSLYRRISKR